MYDPQAQANIHVKAFAVSSQRERQEQLLPGLDDDFSLPISHRADEALDTSGTDVASVDKALTADNKGYQLLLKMGWTGKGLGRNEDGKQLFAVDHCTSHP